MLSPRYKFRPRKGESPLYSSRTTGRARASALVFLDSELVRAQMPAEAQFQSHSAEDKKSDFEKLPAEICGMIFGFALSEEWNGKTPALIKAMRADKNRYPECMLAWYNQKHTYVFHEKNNWSFLDMPQQVITTITKLEIIVDENIALHPLLVWRDMSVIQDRLPMSVHDLAHTAALATSVTSVTLNPRPITTNLFFWYPQKFGLFFSGFKNLKYAATTCPIKPDDVWSMAPPVAAGFVDSDWQATSTQNGIAEANGMLGTVAKLDRVYADVFNEFGTKAHRLIEHRDKWVWIAEKGQSLKEIKLLDGLRMDPYVY